MRSPAAGCDSTRHSDRRPPLDVEADGPGGVTLVGCWAHCRRYMFEATQVQHLVGGGTYAAERRIENKALRRGGLSPADARAGRSSASGLPSAIRDYGRTLVPLPDEASDLSDLIDVYPNDCDSTKYSLDVPLWTAEEGRSDLTLSLVATKQDHKYRLEISDVHVL